MGALLAFQSNLVHKTCGKCGIEFALPEVFDAKRREDKETWYCPNGHARAYTESEADRLRRELEQERRNLALERNRAYMAERARGEAERKMVRLQKRVNAGVCPHCQRTVQQLARHIQSKHPDCVAHATGSLQATEKRIRLKKR